MKNKILSSLAALALSAGMSSALADEIKLGFIGPITGSLAELGQAMQHAAEMAVDQANEAGGVTIDGKTYKITLALGDTEGTVAERAVTATQRVIQFNEVVGIVGNAISTNVLAQLPIIQQSGVPYINIAGKSVEIPTRIARDNLDYVFQLSPTNTDLVTSHGAFLKKNFPDIKKAAFISFNTDAARDYAIRAEKHWGELFPGLEFDQKYVEATRMDFQPEILRIREFNPDVLYVLFAGAQTYAFVDQIASAQLNDKMIILGDSEYAAPDFPKKTTSKTNLHFASAVTFRAPITEVSLPFFDTFQERYNIPAAYYAVQSYDAALMMIEGLRRMEKITGDLETDRNALRDALETITPEKPVTTVRGVSYFTSLETGHMVAAEVAITQFQDGEAVLVWPEGSGTVVPPLKN